MFKPNIDTYVKTSVLTAVQQVYFYQPHRKNEVIHWYDQVIDYFIENADNQNLNSSELLALTLLKSGKSASCLTLSDYFG